MEKEELIKLARKSGNEHCYCVDYGMYDSDYAESADCCAMSYFDGMRQAVEWFKEALDNGGDYPQCEVEDLINKLENSLNQIDI